MIINDHQKVLYDSVTIFRYKKLQKESVVRIVISFVLLVVTSAGVHLHGVCGTCT